MQDIGYDQTQSLVAVVCQDSVMVSETGRESKEKIGPPPGTPFAYTYLWTRRY
jgi:hypothetical protein